MALNDKDLKKIGEVVKTKVTKEIGFLRLEMNQRFDKTDEKMGSNHKEVLEKIEEIKKMESEDIQAVADDVAKLEKKIVF